MIIKVELVFLLITGAPAYVNIAVSGTASQTDNRETYSTADKAIDGNTDGVWKTDDRNSIAMPLSTGPEVFWLLKLKKKQYIDRVVVWNRQDYRTDRIDGVRLLLDGNLVKTFEWECPLQVKFVADGLDVTATSVKLLAPKQSDGTFSIAEVEVYGADSKEVNPDPAPATVVRCGEIQKKKIRLTNIAKLGVATQIDDYDRYTTAGEAIDGNTYGRYTGNSATSMSLTKSHSPGVSWWKLTFPKPIYIERIVLWNRMDYQLRIGGVTMLIDGKQVAKFVYVANQASYPVNKIEKIGKEIKLLSSKTNDGYIELAELEVFGSEEIPETL